MGRNQLSVLILAVVVILFGSIAGASAGGGRFCDLGAGDGKYALIAWNDLGMHCIDHDYSVFAILPPYNNLHAQLIDRHTGKPVTSGVTITYEATPDTRGSINTTSNGKTNFWQWALSLFGVSLPEDMGLAGNPVQSLKPAPMTYDKTIGCWKATGIPLVPYDDQGKTNYYPMVKVVAKDWKGEVLATTRTVLPVSDELACSHCHSSDTGDPAAQPTPDWVRDPDAQKDWKRNILLLHDNRNGENSLYSKALADKGYEPSGLLVTSDGGTPILCANCHLSNALGTKGVVGIRQLTTSMHSWHGARAMDDNTGMPLDMTMDRSGCYYCHPGSTTQCLRGVMGSAKNQDGKSVLECQSCHGPMSKVGSDGRAGWIDLPKCQYCHYRTADGSYTRSSSAFDENGNFNQSASTFGTGNLLYKVAATHGNTQCEACHGSTHAEYATTEANDNVQSDKLQHYSGTIGDCSVCHQRELPVNSQGGPHGLHAIGQIWVNTHVHAARTEAERCNSCHGNDYRGTRLSRAFTSRSFHAGRLKRVTYEKGQVVGCYDCHDRWKSMQN